MQDVNSGRRDWLSEPRPRKWLHLGEIPKVQPPRGGRERQLCVCGGCRSWHHGGGQENQGQAGWLKGCCPSGRGKQPLIPAWLSYQRALRQDVRGKSRVRLECVRWAVRIDRLSGNKCDLNHRVRQCGTGLRFGKGPRKDAGPTPWGAPRTEVLRRVRSSWKDCALPRSRSRAVW